jgi:hypothetical protein
MADFQNIASLIALGPRVPSVDFSGLGNLPNAYWEGLNQAHTQELQDLFKGGRLPVNPDGSVDYGQVSRMLLEHGGAGAVGTALPLMRLQAYDTIARQPVPPIPGQNPPTISGENTGRPASTETIPVPRQPTVMGDADGVKLDIYDAPTTPGARPPMQPDAAALVPRQSQAPQFAQRYQPAQALPPSQELPALPKEAQAVAWDKRAAFLNRRAELAEFAGASGAADRADAAQASANAQDIRKALYQAAQPPEQQKLADRAGMSTLDYGRQQKANEAQVDLEKEQTKEVTGDYKTANAGLYRLKLIDDSIKKLGPDWMGTGANYRANAAKLYNSMRELLPQAAKDNVAAINPGKIASWEDFNKQTMNLGFELARTLGSREAQQIVKQATGSVPGATQTFWGARLVAASMRQAFQRTADFREFLRTVPPGQRLDADVAFNKVHPVDEYVSKATSVVPSQASIDYLRGHPETREQFDARFGDGASVGVFGSQ